MIKAAAQSGWLDEDRAILESLLAFKRAGCAGRADLLRPARGPLAEPLGLHISVISAR
jgi:porphobilinogen synthase